MTFSSFSFEQILIPRKTLRAISVPLFAVLALLPLFSPQRPRSFLITDARVADGTGAPLYKANVRVALSHVVGIGDLQPEKDEPTIDARGLVLAPGFIDIHNHSEDGLVKDPLAETQIAQGITTLIVGADGDSPWPIIAWLRSFEAYLSERRHFRGSRHHSRTCDAQGLQARRRAAGNPSNGAAPQPGHEPASSRPFVRPRIRRGQLLHH